MWFDEDEVARLAVLGQGLREGAVASRGWWMMPGELSHACPRPGFSMLMGSERSVCVDDLRVVGTGQNRHSCLVSSCGPPSLRCPRPRVKAVVKGREAHCSGSCGGVLGGREASPVTPLPSRRGTHKNDHIKAVTSNTDVCRKLHLPLCVCVCARASAHGGASGVHRF